MIWKTNNVPAVVYKNQIEMIKSHMKHYGEEGLQNLMEKYLIDCISIWNYAQMKQNDLFLKRTLTRNEKLIVSVGQGPGEKEYWSASKESDYIYLVRLERL